MKFKVFWIIFCAAALLSGCKGDKQQGRTVEALPRAEVRSFTVSAQGAPLQTEVVGTVQAVRQAAVAAKVTGSIEQVPVVLGSPVKTGDLLVQLRAGEISAKVLQAEAQLEQARRNLERERKLLQKNAATAEMVRSLEEMHRIAEAAYREAKTMLDYTTITAPFDGVVTSKNAGVGDLATPGTPLLHLEDSRELQVVAAVPEALVLQLQAGDMLPVHIPAAGINLTGTVAEVAPASDPRSRTAMVKLNIEEAPLLRSGQFARVTLTGKQGQALFVPASAVQRFGQMDRLFVISGDTVRLRLVRIGMAVNDRVEILAGLEPGEQVAIPAGAQLGRAAGVCCSMNNTPSEFNGHEGFAGWLARSFVDSKLTPLVILASLLLGLLAVALLPREEEPQIKVPMIDVMVSMPGATPKEIEERVSIPMEKLLYELPGIEYIYSTSMPGQCLLIARFYVGQDLEEAIVSLNQKLETNFDRIPHGVSKPLIKPRTIDDVPILALTLHSSSYDHFTLRRLAAQVDDALKNIPEVAETRLIGGTRREVRIRFDPLLLAARNLTAADLVPRLQEANRQSLSGSLQAMNREVVLQSGTFLDSAGEIGRIVVGVHGGKPVYLDEVAEIVDGPEEPGNYVLFGKRGAPEEAAVTLSLAKRPGANAVRVVQTVQRKVDSLRGHLIPADVEVTITRDYGQTAAEKSNELLLHMGIAVFGVALLILFFLGWRESLVVMLAIPSTLALTLLVFYLYGYTLNRITLFALIFSIGILVDDAIVVVENIVRHLRLPANRDRALATVAVEAVIEVGNPTILATWAVIAAILPMAFVGGLMGPYMRPIPIGSSAAMLFSLIIAFTVTPWAAVRLLSRHRPPAGAAASNDEQMPDDFFTRLYHRIMDPLLAHGSMRLLFFVLIIALLLGSCSMVYFGLVKVKMLPFDNKSEFQMILDMPEGSTLEHTTRVAREMAAVIAGEPEVVNYQVYAGTAAPFNFNGLVRHYFLRAGPNVADIQVNLLPRHEREGQSHDVAKRIRPAISEIAQRYNAAVAVAEVPPGPPVLQTLVAEIYGPTEKERVALAAEVRKIFENTEGVVDIDWYREADRSKTVITVDKEKAALHHISEGEVTGAIQMAVQGMSIDLFHQPRDKEEIDITLELPRALRARVEGVLNIHLRPAGEPDAPLVPLRELVRLQEMPVDQPIYRKNLKPVVYVTGDVAGAAESPVYAILAMNKKLRELKGTDGWEIGIYNLNQPFSDLERAMKWDGEWHITLEVFRDLGLAFCVVMILIYMLMVGWFKGYITPLVVMAAIPFSLIGILPAHWGFGAFFTATSMIGFMAGAGIVVRNSIILVDFIELRLSHGLPLAQAVVEAGAIRFRPMLLTALAVVVGASVILADPIFQGLAISLMFGEIASLLISRMAVPVLYFLVKRHR